MNFEELSDDQLRAEFKTTLANYNLFISLDSTLEDEALLREKKDAYLEEILTELKRRLKDKLH